MLEQLKYKNHMNEVFAFGQNGIFVDSNELRDYEWSVDKKNNRISALKYAVRKKKLPVTIICPTEAQSIAAKNKLFEVVEKDVLAMKHGQVILGDYHMDCFVTKSAKKDYLTNNRLLKLTLTLTTDRPYWVRETTVPYGVVDDDAAAQTFLDYAMDFPVDYYSDAAVKPITNTGFVASNFRLVIYGACTNPSVIIADHIYQVNCTVNENEYLTIDSSAKTIFLTAEDGTTTNVFNDRERSSYVFEKIPAGQSVVSWSGEFAFDITLLEERSEPKWI